jgi:peptidoglycan-associated lipoprotein
VRIEGNCDERGSSTYNLALGQRRADFVKRALELLGADAKQITAVSLGAERPKALGSSDASRAQNRPSDLKYIGVDVDYLHRPYR